MRTRNFEIIKYKVVYTQEIYININFIKLYKVLYIYKDQNTW